MFTVNKVQFREDPPKLSSWWCLLTDLLAAAQFRRDKNAFLLSKLSLYVLPLVLSLSLSISISLSDSASLGKLRPFPDTPLVLSHTHIHFQSLFSLSLVFFPTIYPTLCISSLHLRGIWSQRRCCHIRGCSEWQNDDSQRGWGPLDWHIDHQCQYMNRKYKHGWTGNTHFEYAFPNLSPDPSKAYSIAQ